MAISTCPYDDKDASLFLTPRVANKNLPAADDVDAVLLRLGEPAAGRVEDLTI